MLCDCRCNPYLSEHGGGSVYSVPHLLLNRLGCGGCMLSIIAVVQGGQPPAAIRANGQRATIGERRRNLRVE